VIIHVLRKPLSGTVAQNALQHGCGVLNIDGCRVGFVSEADKKSAFPGSLTSKSGALAGGVQNNRERNAFDTQQHQAGRWPANLVHDGSEEVVETFPSTKAGVAMRNNSGGNTFGGDKPKPPMADIGYGDSGSASRFFQQVTIK